VLFLHAREEIASQGKDCMPGRRLQAWEEARDEIACQGGGSMPEGGDCSTGGEGPGLSLWKTALLAKISSCSWLYTSACTALPHIKLLGLSLTVGGSH